ncbi:MAG: DUF4062 domain-containing protein [Methylococcaceae bacterium]|nr:MAG: DUF4062 domain-containing protein [Methylococcaceae bacterium]
MSRTNPTYTVFISSTFIDNQPRRQLVEDAVLRACMQPVGMERFTASANPTLEECERQARDCDVYLGIIAHRYGWIPPGQAVSITELEYDAARAAQRPCLLFEIDGTQPVDVQNDFDSEPDRWVKQEKLDAFRTKYRRDQTPTPFTETSLAVKVLHALNEWRAERTGAVAAPQLPVTDVAAAELDRYRAAALALHASLPLAGFKTKLRVPIALDELYVPLHATLDLRHSGDAHFADANDAAAALYSHGALDIPLIDAFREAQPRIRRMHRSAAGTLARSQSPAGGRIRRTGQARAATGGAVAAPRGRPHPRHGGATGPGNGAGVAREPLVRRRCRRLVAHRAR